MGSEPSATFSAISMMLRRDYALLKDKKRQRQGKNQTCNPPEVFCIHGQRALSHLLSHLNDAAQGLLPHTSCNRKFIIKKCITHLQIYFIERLSLNTSVVDPDSWNPEQDPAFQVNKKINGSGYGFRYRSRVLMTIN